MKEIMKKIIFPNKILGFFLFNISFGLLFFVFFNHMEESVVAYISYPLSFYALLIFCIWFYRMCKFSSSSIKKCKVYKIYQQHFSLTTKVLLSISLFVNLIYGIFKLILGVYYCSWWFITFAIYYLVLCFMKMALVKNFNNRGKEYEKLKDTGIVLLLLNIILIGMIILILKQNQIIKYHEILIYLIALYDFYLIISSFIRVFKYKNKKTNYIGKQMYKFNCCYGFDDFIRSGYDLSIW